MKSIPRPLLAAAFFLLLALLAFRAAWPADQVIHASDFNVGLIASYQKVFPTDWFSGTWSASIGLGGGSSRTINLTNVLIALFPTEFVCDWVYAIHLVIASLALAAFLRHLGLSPAAAAFGALTAFWLASNLTLIYPGHLYKYGVMSAAALFLWLWEKGLATSRPGWFVLAGGAFGLMFLEQQDLAVFCAVLLGPHALWRLAAAGRASGWTPRRLLAAAAAAVPALLLMSQAYLKARAAYIDPVAMTQRSDEDKWGWATQWSWPPAETIDFVAPGYHGLRSGEPGAEYWGEMGQSPEFKATGQGFRNFKLESQYLGVIPLGLALFALALAFAPSARGAEARPLLRFWSVAAVLLFILSCGKYLPLYRLFFELPLMSSIRNPNKFLQVFQLALGVLAACGFEAVFGPGRARLGAGTPAAARWMFRAAAAFAVLMLLGWITVQSASGSLIRDLAGQRYADPAKLAARASSAMAHGFLMSVLFAGLVRLALSTRWAESPSGRRALPPLAFAPVVVDVLLLASHYLVAQPIGSIRGNPVAAYLRTEAAGRRVMALDQSGIYGHMLTFVFPYEGVHFTNLLAAPRVQTDFDQYYRAIGRNLIRQWTHFGVSHVLASAGQWEQIRRIPAFAAVLEPALGWGVVPDAAAGFRVVEMRDRPQHLVLRVKDSPGRAWLAGAWREAPAADIFAALANPAENTETVAWVEPDPAAGALPPSGAPGLAGSVAADRGINRVRMEVQADRPAFLVMSDHFGREFAAAVDGKPAVLRRVNGVLMGLPVPAGKSVVEVRYVMPAGGVRAIQAALAVCLLGGLSLLRRPRAAVSPSESR